MRGRPGRLGRDRAACRLAIRSRCHRSTVSGRTSRLSLPNVRRGRRCSNAANTARVCCGETRSPLAKLAFQNGDLSAAERGSPHLCPDRPSAVTAARRTRSRRSGNPAATARTDIMPPNRQTHPIAPTAVISAHERATRPDEFFGKDNVDTLAARSTSARSPAGPLRLRLRLRLRPHRTARSDPHARLRFVLDHRGHPERTVG